MIQQTQTCFVQCNPEVPKNLQENLTNFPTNFRTVNAVRDDFFFIYERIRRERRTFDSTQENVNVKLFLGEWNKNHDVDVPLFGFGAGMQRNLSILAVHSNDLFQHFRSVCSECLKRTGRESSFYCGS